MTDPTVLWPALLGIAVLVTGIVTYRREVSAAGAREAFGLMALGPTFIAAAIAAFAGEHFTAGPSLAQLVPKFLPARLFIAYFVGAAHLAAAISFVARRYVRWSAFWLCVMFALFVLLMDLPTAVTHPGMRMAWILAARETTFSVGALAVWAMVMRADRPAAARTVATVARVWMACVLVYYGIDNLLHPQFSPGVPDTMHTAAWVPAPEAVAYLTGLVLVAFGLAMFARRHAATAAACAGSFMVLLSLVLYVPQFFLASTVGGRVTGINFVFDTLLFAGTVLAIGGAIRAAEAPAVAAARAPAPGDAGVSFAS